MSFNSLFWKWFNYFQVSCRARPQFIAPSRGQTSLCL